MLRLQSRDRGKESEPRRYSRGDGSKAEGIRERRKAEDARNLSRAE